MDQHLDGEPRRIVTDSMIGLRMPDYARYSERVATVLGQNPSPFTGPGTNTYLIGTGCNRLLLDTGRGVDIWTALLTCALEGLCHAERIDRIILTHAHADHAGGVRQVCAKFGELEVLKKRWPGHDEAAGLAVTRLEDGATVRTEGATLRAIHTPGHRRSRLLAFRRCQFDPFAPEEASKRRARGRA